MNKEDSMSAKMAVPVILIAGGMVYLAEQFKMPRLIPMAIGLFGLFGVVLGIDTFVHGKIELLNRQYSRREYYSGAMARLIAIIIFLFGAGVTIYSVWEWLRPGAPSEYLAGLVQSPLGWGMLLFVSGIFVTLFGILHLVAGSGWKKEEREVLVELGFRLRGLIGLVLGIVMLLGAGYLVLL